MLVWAVWCYPDTCLELLKVIWSWAVFPDESVPHSHDPNIDRISGSVWSLMRTFSNVELCA